MNLKIVINQVRISTLNGLILKIREFSRKD